MTDKIEDIQILFMNRRARKRGPTSSDQENDTNDELAHDLATFGDQWNNRLVPLTDALPNGSPSTAVDAFTNGLDGANVFVDQDATTVVNPVYYNTVDSRPNTILEQFAVAATDLASATDTLQGQLDNKILTAAQISIEDTGGLLVAANVENALAEITTAVNSLSGGSGSVDLTAVTTSVIPNTNNVRDLGSATFAWKDSYVAGRAFYRTGGGAATPTIALGDGDSGLWESIDDTMNMALAGTAAWVWNTTFFAADGLAGGPVIVRQAATSTAATLVPSAIDFDTGIGWAAADQLSLIAGGIEVARCTEAATGTGFSTRAGTLTLGAAATTFAIDGNLMTVTGDGGANTIATITGAVAGTVLILIFVDALVTVTDDNSHAADSVDLSAAFTSADDTVLQLVYDGTSWYEVSRSVN